MMNFNSKLRTTPLKAFAKTSPLNQLVGGQKKLDKNKDGKLDKEDFKILRGEKSSPLNASGMDSYMKGMSIGGGLVIKENKKNEEDVPSKKDKEIKSRKFSYTFPDGITISLKKEGGKTSDGGKDITRTFTAKNILSPEVKLRKTKIEKDPNTGVRTATRSLYGLDGKVRKTIVKEGKPFRMKKDVFKGPEAQKMFDLKFGG